MQQLNHRKRGQCTLFKIGQQEKGREKPEKPVVGARGG